MPSDAISFTFLPPSQQPTAATSCPTCAIRYFCNCIGNIFTEGKMLRRKKSRTIILPFPLPPPKKSHFTFSPRMLTMRQGNFYRWNLSGGINFYSAPFHSWQNPRISLGSKCMWDPDGSSSLVYLPRPKGRVPPLQPPREAPEMLLHLPAVCLSRHPHRPWGSCCVLSNYELTETSSTWRARTEYSSNTSR